MLKNKACGCPRALRAVLIVALAAAMLLSLSSCDLINGILNRSCEHADVDRDGSCDKCGEAYNGVCTEHSDENADGSCDSCGECLHRDNNCDGVCDGCEGTMSVKHEDGDSDRRCDKCGAVTVSPCEVHTDGECDGVCDVCYAEVEVEHTDADGDKRCDRCNKCLKHTDSNCDGKCDRCAADTPIAHADADNDGRCDKCSSCISHRDGGCDGLCDNCGASVPVLHVDTDGGGVCDKCGSCVTHADGNCDGVCDRCASATAIVHKDTDGNRICDKCGAVLASACVTHRDSDCDGVCDECYSTVEIEHADANADSECDKCGKCLAHTDNNCDGYCDRCAAEVEIMHEDRNLNSVCDKCGVRIPLVFNSVDRRYIEKAARILSISTYTGLDFAKHAYTVAFTNPKAITNILSGTPEQALALILSGSDEAVMEAIPASLLTGGKPAESVSAGDLVSGDLVYVKSGSAVRMYFVAGEEAYDITERATKVSISALISAIGTSESYAAVRPSYTIKNFTQSDPDERPEVMNAFQEAIVKTAEAYLLRGESLQYEDVQFGLNSQSGEYRWAYGQKSPEEYTTDEWGYVNCAVFTYEVYLQALGYTLPRDMYTTARLSSNAEALGMLAFRFTNTTPGEYTEEYMAEIEAEFMAALEVGDIINVRRKTATGTSGHAMLYVGNGRFIHSGGGSYSKTSAGVGYEVYEPTIRCHKVKDYIFDPSSVGGNPFRGADEYGTTYVTELILVRPLNAFDGEIPTESQNRIENMQDIRAEKLSSHPSSVTINPGELITFTFSIFNVGDAARTVEIYDKIPAGTSYVSGGDRASGDELYWTVTVGAGETVTVSYTVRVNEEIADGTLIDNRDATVGGVMHRCAAIRVKRTLTEGEQAAVSAAIEALKAKGTSLSGLALVNEIYKRALGIEGIFADTNADSVMRDGSESVFATSSKVNNKKNLSKLQSAETYYSGMLVDHLYGGMRFDSSEKTHDRTRLLREHNLVIGDVLIARKSSAVNVYIYAGDGSLILLNSGVGDSVNFTTTAETIMYYGRDFAVLRPSQQFEG